MDKNPVAVLFSIKDQYAEAAARDLFALGCYLYSQGHTRVGAKTCATALLAAKCENVREVIDQLDDRAAEFARACAPHAEVVTFLEQNMAAQASH